MTPSFALGFPAKSSRLPARALPPPTFPRQRAVVHTINSARDPGLRWNTGVHRLRLAGRASASAAARAAFIGSGCAALIYEIVWFQLLSLIIGSSAISMGVLLGTFMGGMCIGSLLLSKYISRAAASAARIRDARGRHRGVRPARALGNAIRGGLYFAIAVHGMSGLFLRGLFCALCLLPPTLLMGATLPAIARWVETTPEGVAWLGFFYGGNIAGAVFGCLLAGFYLLRVYDMAVRDVRRRGDRHRVVALASLALARVHDHAAGG